MKILFFYILFFLINLNQVYCQKISDLSFVEKMGQSIKIEDLNYNNDNGHLAWATIYLVDAYNKMYKITKDVDYLNKVSLISKKIYENTDFNKGKSNFLEKREPLWSSTKYSKSNERLSWVIHTGMITYPIAEFCLIIKENESLHKIKDDDGDKLIEVAERLINCIEESIEAHDDEWNSEKGYYFYPSNYPSTEITKENVLPHNQYLALGRTLILMYKITNNKLYKEKTLQMARYFKSNLVVKNDSYVWRYHPELRYEDISHGAIDVEFAYECYQMDWLFNKKDLILFSNTINSAIKENLNVNNLVYQPKSKMTNKYKDSVLLWSRLGKFNPELTNKIEKLAPQILKKTNQRIIDYFAAVNFYYYIVSNKY